MAATFAIAVGPLALSVGLAFCCCACSDSAPAPQPIRQSGPFAQRLLADQRTWRTFEGPPASLHVRPSSLAEQDIDVIVKAVTDVRREVLDLIGATESQTVAHLFFVDSRDDVRQLIGRPVAGFVQEDEPTAVFMYTREFRLLPLLRHELTHLYTFDEWGRTEHGAWLTEGVAIWATKGCQGHSSDALAAGVLARGAIVPLTQLSARFREVPEDVAMSQAGSIVTFLIKGGGIAAIRSRWPEQTSQLPHPLGTDGPRLETEWLAHLRTVKPATLDLARGLREGC
jgi:hypothetical protein